MSRSRRLRRRAKPKSCAGAACVPACHRPGNRTCPGICGTVRSAPHRPYPGFRPWRTPALRQQHARPTVCRPKRHPRHRQPLRNRFRRPRSLPLHFPRPHYRQPHFQQPHSRRAQLRTSKPRRGRPRSPAYRRRQGHPVPVQSREPSPHRTPRPAAPQPARPLRSERLRGASPRDSRHRLPPVSLRPVSCPQQSCRCPSLLQ